MRHYAETKRTEAIIYNSVDNSANLTTSVVLHAARLLARSAFPCEK
jgi:hypothetical protein